MEISTDLELKQALLAPPGASDDKYSRGVVGFVTGSDRYPGAALLGINAALELGIGMVCFQGSESLKKLVISQRPEVVLELTRADSLVIGSGLDVQSLEQAAFVRQFFLHHQPKVLDAGALEIANFHELRGEAILTPHLREAVRLATRLGINVEETEPNPKDLAIEIAMITHQVVLVKGSKSEIATPSALTATFGPADPNLATAGTGDVLAGIIGALLARAVKLQFEINENNLVQICLIANQIHSRAARISSSRHEHGASAIAAAISQAREIEYSQSH